MIAALLAAAGLPAMFAATLGAAAPNVAVTGSCPTSEALKAALAAALGDEAPRRNAAPRVSDLGGSFEVAALGQSQRYSDPTRDCAERARVAAVFIALTLNPPDLPAQAPPAPPPTPPAPATIVAAATPPVETAPATWAALGAAGRVDGGATGGAVGYTAGLELRATVGRRAWGVAATAGILAPLDSQLGSTVGAVTVRQQRYPLSLSAMGRHALSSRLAITGAAGVALVPFTLRGEGLATSVPATRLDAGVRLAGAVEVPLGRRLDAFVELHAEYFPRTYDLAIDPAGTIGSTGRLWVGASVGLAFAANGR